MCIRDSLTFAVVTTKAQSQAEVVLHQLNMAHYFRHIQGSQPGLRHKPAPDTIEKTLKCLEIVPQQALMVGDTSADIQAGQAASVKTCAVTYGFGRLETLQACDPDYWLSSFADLPRLLAD